MLTFGALAVGASPFWFPIAQPSSSPVIPGAGTIQPLTRTGKRAGCKDAGNEGFLTCRLLLALEKCHTWYLRGLGRAQDGGR